MVNGLAPSHRRHTEALFCLCHPAAVYEYVALRARKRISEKPNEKACSNYIRVRK